MIAYAVMGIILIAASVKFYFRKQIEYSFSMTRLLVHRAVQKTYYHPTVLSATRIIILCILGLLIAKPQWVDLRSQLPVNGIDIILAIDVSGSMQNLDSPEDNRSRFAIAQEEAIRFIKKRTNDAIGLVLFGTEAITRCPITLDKRVLEQIVSEAKIGDIDPNKTMLASGVLTAINRLKSSKAKSKIIILLTDGAPSPGDHDMEATLEIAKKLGIKIYAIGIGSQELVAHHFFQLLSVPRVNEALLQHIARQTGGQCFMAHNAQDMRAIYDTINQLETIKHEVPVFSIYYDIFIPFLILVLLLLAFEIGMTTFVWYGL